MIKPSPPRGMSATQIHDARTDYSTVPDELRSEISRLQADNKHLKKEIEEICANRIEIVGKMIKHEEIANGLRGQLRTAEQRVARECCEIVGEYLHENADSGFDIVQDETADEIISAIKAKYGL